MRRISKIAIMAAMLVAVVGASGVADDIKFKTDPPQRIDAAFRLFTTENVWTHLLLDTTNGRIWQVTFSTSSDGVRGKIPINDKPLVIANAMKPGRFTLYPTVNVWTFILLDQEDGRVWQCQFSLDANKRFILPLEDVDSAVLHDLLKNSKGIGENSRK